jgi:hypothetical protein
MNLLRNRILLLLLVCAIALFGLIQAFNVLANKNLDQVHQELQKILGKEIHFEKLEASFFGGIGFSAKEFSVADHPRFAATPFVRASCSSGSAFGICFGGGRYRLVDFQRSRNSDHHR